MCVRAAENLVFFMCAFALHTARQRAMVRDGVDRDGELVRECVAAAPCLGLGDDVMLDRARKIVREFFDVDAGLPKPLHLWSNNMLSMFFALAGFDAPVVELSRSQQLKLVRCIMELTLAGGAGGQ